MISFQLISCDCCLNISIARVLALRLQIKVVSLSNVTLAYGRKRQIGKSSEISVLKIADLKLVSTMELVRMWSIAVAVFIVTLLGLFIVGIKLFS